MDTSHHGSSSAQFPFPYNNTSNAHHNVYHPAGLSFLGSIPPSFEQGVQSFNAWMHSPGGCFPSQPLRGPGEPGPSSSIIPDSPTVPNKRKRTLSPERAAVGGYGPIPGDPHEEPSRRTPDQDPSPEIEFNERKNSAYDVWAFARGLLTNETIPADQWPRDYNQHLTKRPDESFLGCKFCTEFG